jgi:hypothetical protein
VVDAAPAPPKELAKEGTERVPLFTPFEEARQSVLVYIRAAR